MAYGDNATSATSKAAMATNQFMNHTAINMFSKVSPILYAATGYGQDMTISGESGQFAHMTFVDGIEHEYRWAAQKDTISTVADGAGELASVSVSYNDDAFLGGSAPLTHFANKHFIPGSALTRLSPGKSSKGRSYLDEEVERWMASYRDEFATQMNSDADQSQTTIGGWVYAIDSANSYLDIDRSATGNTWAQSQEDTTAAANTLYRMQKLKRKCRKFHGNPQLAVGDDAAIADVQQLVEAKNTQYVASHNPKWAEFGGDTVFYSGMTFVQDAYAPATTIGFIDEDTVDCVMNKDGFKLMDLGFHQDKVSVKVWHSEFWCGLFFKDPRKCAKLSNYTIS
jgi:hypothetical protein